jgi:hypothetical protein
MSRTPIQQQPRPIRGAWAPNNTLVDAEREAACAVASAALKLPFPFATLDTNKPLRNDRYFALARKQSLTPTEESTASKQVVVALAACLVADRSQRWAETGVADHLCEVLAWDRSNAREIAAVRKLHELRAEVLVRKHFDLIGAVARELEARTTINPLVIVQAVQSGVLTFP